MPLSPLRPDDLGGWTRALIAGLLDLWPDVDAPDLPSRRIRASVAQLGAHLETPAVGGPEMWSSEGRTLADTLEPVLSSSSGTEREPVGSMLRALYSAAMRSMWSAPAREVLRQSEAVRQAAAAAHDGERRVTELLAALMVVEDATMAIEGYAASPPFLHVDEAYLAKYGLLQAFQAGLDAAEAIGRYIGLKVDAWRAGGKVALEARNIVAGHPVSGTMAGEAWHHFHDRGSAADKSAIRVMSFSKSEPDRWLGQTIRTEDLMTTGLQVMADLLSRCAAHLEAS